MKKLLLLLPLAFAFACGDSKPEEEVIDLKTHKDKLSYVLGAMNAKDLLTQGGPNIEQLDKDLMVEGYKSNLNENDPRECMEVFKNLFGPYGQDMDTTYKKEGSKCAGRVSAAEMYAVLKKWDELVKIDLDMLVTGFKHGLNAKDTLIGQTEKDKLLQDFFEGMKVKQMAEMQRLEKPFWAKVKSIKGIQELESGIYLETISAGKGGSPVSSDDVEAHYTLTSVTGDTIESSLQMEPLKINLGKVIPGWILSFPHMKKGGKYRLYIPSDMAYGNGALCFYIELINYGAAGTLVQPQPQQMPQGM